MNGKVFEKCPTCGFATIYKTSTNQPKPATETVSAPFATIVNHSVDIKPTGEWTGEMVEQMLGAEGVTAGIGDIVASHNAALANAQTFNQLNADTIKRLTEQLAAATARELHSYDVAKKCTDELAAEREAHNPATTGEWTADTVFALLMSQEDDHLANEAVADAHNGALAAEEERVTREIFDKYCDDPTEGAMRAKEKEIQQLREQLAAERERTQMHVRNWEKMLAVEKGKVEECTRLLALAQEQQEELVTGLKTIRTLTKDVEICAMIDATFINLK